MSLVIPILLLGLLAALSPSTLTVFILLLGTLRAKVNAVAFMVGWTASLSIVFVVSYELGGSGPLQSHGGRTGIYIAEIVLGLALGAIAVREWRRRHQPQKRSKVSQRLAVHMETLHPWEAVVVGVLKEPWTITAAAAVVVVHHHEAALVTICAFLVFTAVSTATVGAIFMYYARQPGEADTYLIRLQETIGRAGSAIIAVISLVVGLYLGVDGVVGLLAN